MYRIERYHRAETVIRERQSVGPAEVQTADDFRLAMHQRVLGDIEPECFQSRTDFHQIFHQKTLGAADVEHAVAWLEPEVAHHVLGDRDPATVVPITAVADFARAIEVKFAVLTRDFDVLRGLRLPALLDVALRLRQPRQQVHFRHRIFSADDFFARASPSSSGVKWNSGKARWHSVISKNRCSKCGRGTVRGVACTSTPSPNWD